MRFYLRVLKICFITLCLCFSFASKAKTFPLEEMNLKKIYFACGEVELHLLSIPDDMETVTTTHNNGFKELPPFYSPDDRILKFISLNGKCAEHYIANIQYRNEIEIKLGSGELRVFGILKNNLYKSIDAEVENGGITARIPEQKLNMNFDNNHLTILGIGNAIVKFKVGKGTLILN